VGGVRRRREAALAGAYDLAALDTVVGVGRVIDIVLADTLSLDNGVQRNRTLLAAAMAALKALETGELQDRVEALEAVVQRLGREPAPFADTDRLEEIRPIGSHRWATIIAK
jgi:hypothetical protein